MPLVPLDAGVHAWLQERPGLGRANAGVVVENDGITLIDTLFVESQWGPFGEEVEAMALPIRRIVLTSSNAEYTGGTAHFRFAAVYGRAQTSAHLDQPADPAVLRTLYPDQAEEIDDEFSTRPVTHTIGAAVQLTPAITVVPMAGQQAENLVAVVPGAAIVFAGAMCWFGVTPLAHQGDPGAWADGLDALLELAPIVVPGHGPIGGEEEVRELQAYLRACVDAEGDPAAMPSGPWDEWPGRENDAVNIERAALLARGEDAIPPSLLDRLR